MSKIQKTLILLFIIITLLLIVIVFYNKSVRHNDNGFGVNNDTVYVKNEILLDSIKLQLGELPKNIASPVEIAVTIERLKIPFANEYLLNTDLDKYNNSNAKAIALGGIGVDLMYLNFNKQNGKMITPLMQIHHLTEDLYISQFFDFAMLKQLATSTLTKTSIDSLKYLSTYNINKMEEYLLSGNRLQLGVYMTLGAWTEGLYLLTRVATDHPGEFIYERVGDQKLYMIQMYKMLNLFKEENGMKVIINHFESLKKEMNRIEIRYVNIGKPWRSVNIQGKPVWYQPQKSVVIIDSAQIQNIAKEIKVLRDFLFLLN